MVVNGTGSLVVLVIVLLGALAFQAQVEGKPQDNFKRDKEDNVSRIVDNSDTNSLGPKEAKKGQFPWQVLMDTGIETKLCGGSIIDQYWVMSAAHCLADPVQDILTGIGFGYKIKENRKINIIAGITDKKDNGVNRQTRKFSADDISATGNDKRVFIHKDFHKDIEFNNDIVLFKLKEPLYLNEFVKPILLATAEDYNPEEKKLIASGWGLTGIAGDNPIPDKLRYVEGLMLKSPSECKDIFVASEVGFDKDTMICHSTENKDINPGDSGGPFVLPKSDPLIYGTHAYVQIGITSFRNLNPKTEGYPSVFTNVAYFRPWIHTTMGYSPDDPNCPDGYFHSSGKWYRMFKEQGPVSWEDAQRKCQSKGMQLAEPNKAKAVKLRKDALNKLGDGSNAWIGARGYNGREFEFVGGQDPVPQNSNLFWKKPLDEYMDLCLILEVTQERWELYPNKPYHYVDCSDTIYSYPLCEDSPDNQVCLFNQIATFTRSGSVRCVPTTDVVPTATSCPEDGDYFTLTVGGPKQCFKVLKQSATWEQANKDCMDLNLTLAQPFAPVQLRSYIVQEYGSDFYVWLGACQDEPNKMMWKEGGEEITNEDPLWYPDQPNSHEGCLLLLTSETYWQKEPEKPFWNVKPTYEFYPLCELVLA